MKDLCEVCGKREASFLTLIEGAKLMACSSCARTGKVLHSLLETSEGATVIALPERKAPIAFREEESIIDDYGKLIRKARNEKGMKREEVAKALNEKESYLEHIEKEKTLPPMKVIKKLERFFGIKLTEKSTPDVTGDSLTKKQDARRPFTLADALEDE